MSFIRTVDADGNPIMPEPEQLPDAEPLPEARQKAQPEPGTVEPMTQKQANALNAFLARAEREDMAPTDLLIEARNLMRREKINDGIRKRVLMNMIRTEYMDPDRDFTGKQAVTALNMLIGTPKKAAAAQVDSWKHGETGKAAEEAAGMAEEQEISDNGSSDPGQY